MRPEYPDLAGITVLVDDDAETRKVIRAALNHAGADTMCAASGTEALQQLDRVAPARHDPGRSCFGLCGSERERKSLAP